MVIRTASLSSARRLFIGATFLARVTLLLTSVASSDAAQLRNVDGGQNYYGEFSASLPSDPIDFPNSVWFDSAISQADSLQERRLVCCRDKTTVQS
jgi:hypothetical protein